MPHSSLSVYNLLPQTESVVELGAGPGDAVVVPEGIRSTEFVASEAPVFHDTLFLDRLSSENEIIRTDWETIIAAIWLCGCGMMIVLFFRQTAICRRWIRQGNPVRSERILTVFESCRHRMKVDTWLVIAESKAVAGPFLIGAIRPTLLLPHGMIESASEKQLRTVFLHELAHLRRWDVWTGWVMTVLLVVHWFNPLLWLAIRRMNADREEACDALALETLSQNDRHDYARSLLDITENFVVPNKFTLQMPGLAGISETGKFLTRRIEMLKQIGTWKLRWNILALVAVLFLGVTTLTDRHSILDC